MDEYGLLELCKHVVNVGEKLGATAVEALARSVDQISSDIEHGEISGVNRGVADEIAIRIFMGRKIGSAFTNIATDKALEEAIDFAISSAKATSEDKDWRDLPKPGSYPEVNDLWNESLARTEPSKVVDLARELIVMGTAKEPSLIPAYGGSQVSIYRSAFANSYGIAHAEKGSIAFAGLGAIAQIDRGVTPLIYSYTIDRTLNLDLDSTISDIVNTLRICKNTTEGESGKHPVILYPRAYGQILFFTLQQSIRGDNVARGKSMLKNRIGEKVASEYITIVDDGIIPRGTNTSVADDEGIPRQKTPVIDRGILRSFLWDNYWGNKTGEESTGNANRRTRQGFVEITPTNMVVETGKREIGDIISEVEYGYLIRNVQGAHSSNPESGDFSVVGNPAILIKDGEKLGAVHGLMVSGNVYDLLKQAVEVAKTPLTIPGLIGSEIVFEDVNIISRG